MNWDSDFRLRWLIRLVVIGLISGMFLSWKLWVTDRLYPHFPVWEWLPQFPHPLDTVFVLLFSGCLVWMIFKPSRLVIAGVMLLMLVFALQDQSRWQPWFYQYGLMLIPLIFMEGRRDQNAEETGGALGIQQLMIIMVYIWGGIHKCQPGWMSVWESSLIAPVLERVESESLSAFFVSMGRVIPFVEILMGVGLLFRPTRLTGICAVISTHIVILILLGPVKGTISNSVVWPWNLVMIGMVIVLFYRMDHMSLAAFRNKVLIFPAWGIAFLMTIAPVLFYAGLWDRYLSFSLYAGQQKRYLVRVDAAAVERLPIEWKDYFLDPHAQDGHLILSPGRWSSDELNVPMVSEWRILRAFSRKLCAYDLGDSRPIFFVDHTHLPDKGNRFFGCDEIDEMNGKLEFSR